MATIKFKMFENEVFINAFEKIGNHKCRAANELFCMRYYKAFFNLFQEYMETRQKLIKKYGEPDGKGGIKTLPEDDKKPANQRRVMWQEGCEEKFEQEIKEVRDSDTEFPVIKRSHIRKAGLIPRELCFISDILEDDLSQEDLKENDE